MRRILVLTEWFFPAYKAEELVKSCINLINNLSQQYCFYVLTSDRDIGKKSTIKGVVVDKWIAQTDTQINKNVVRYVSPNNMTAEAITQIINKINPHVIYINTMLSLRYSLRPLYVINKIGFAGKIIIAPRETLAGKGIGYNALKKKYLTFLVSRFHLQSNVFFHATDEGNAALIRKYFGKKSQICMVENFPNLVPVDVYRNKEKKSVKCIYISSLKNSQSLFYAFEVLNCLGKDINVELDIFEPARKKQFLMECLNRAFDLPGNITVNFSKPLHDYIRSKKFQEYHLLFLPSATNHFEQTVLEALSTGCPVLISDQTRLKDIEIHNAGWVLSLTNKKLFAEKIKVVSEMNAEDFSQISNNAREYAYAYINQLKQKYGELFG